MTMRTAYLLPALILAASSASAEPSVAQKIGASHKAHVQRLAKCAAGPDGALCRGRANARLGNALARLDADLAVVRANQRLARVEKGR